MIFKNKKTLLLSCFCGILLLSQGSIYAQQQLTLRFEDAVDIAFQRSRTISTIVDNYQRRFLNVKASRASLRSFSNLNVNLPDFSKRIDRFFDSSSESFVNSESQKVTMDAQWEIVQPIITNGEFSLKSEVRSLSQKDEDRQYRSKIFLEFEQPLFTRNEVKQRIWREELNFELAELNSVSRLLRQYGTFNRIYYDLYTLEKEYEIDSLVVAISQNAYDEAVRQFASGSIDSIQVIRLEVDLLLNQSRLLRTKNDIFEKEMEFKHRFGVDLDDDITLTADLTVREIPIDMERAVEIGLENSPSIREQQIWVEFMKDEIEMADSWSEFKGELEATYGVEREDTKVGDIFSDFDKTQSFELEFRFPLWDSNQNGYIVNAFRMWHQNTVDRLENTKIQRANGIKSALEISFQHRIGQKHLSKIENPQNRCMTNPLLSSVIMKLRVRNYQEYWMSIETYRTSILRHLSIIKSLSLTSNKGLIGISKRTKAFLKRLKHI